MKKGMSKEDRLLSEIMKDFRMDSPPGGFTERVMHSIQLEGSLSPSINRPLISKAGWIGIAIGLGLLILIVFLGNGGEAAAEGGFIARTISSLKLPAVDFGFGNIISWIYVESSTLFWIFVGIGGILLFTVLGRLMERIIPGRFSY